MENIFITENQEETTTDRQTAIIREVGYFNPAFGTAEAGKMLNTEVEVLYVYPVDGGRKTHLGHGHAIVQFADREKTTLLIDCQLDFTGGW